jgi:hypothetical protein
LAKQTSRTVRALVLIALGLSLAGCVVAEPAPPPSYAYYPGYAYAPSGYYPYGGPSVSFSYNSGWHGGHHWHGRDWR